MCKQWAASWIWHHYILTMYKVQQVDLRKWLEGVEGVDVRAES